MNSNNGYQQQNAQYTPQYGNGPRSVIGQVLVSMISLVLGAAVMCLILVAQGKTAFKARKKSKSSRKKATNKSNKSPRPSKPKTDKEIMKDVQKVIAKMQSDNTLNQGVDANGQPIQPQIVVIQKPSPK
uniref:Uncharacterized protein n=1 Tax=Rhabditophanes sp. KR3021 TaxID=114890 RepID=A0AC35TZR8_9BILA